MSKTLSAVQHRFCVELDEFSSMGVTGFFNCKVFARDRAIESIEVDSDKSLVTNDDCPLCLVDFASLRPSVQSGVLDDLWRHIDFGCGEQCDESYRLAQSE